MAKRRYFATIASVALVGPLLTPLHATANETTKTATLPLTCEAIPKTSLAGAQDFSTGTDGVKVDITAPDTVKVGQEFTTVLAIKPVEINVGGLAAGSKILNVSRIKLDIVIPEGLTYLNSDLDTRQSNLAGFEVKRVNEQGEETANGQLLRITSTDNATIGNGPNTGVNSQAGVTHVIENDKINMRFPVLKLHFRADQPGTTNLALRTSGKAGQYGQDENFLTMLAKINIPVPFVGGTVWAPTRCTPREDKKANLSPHASKLTSINVINDAPAADTTLTIEDPHAVVGNPTTLTATVNPAEATGTVTFTSGDSTISAPVKAGSASAEITFPSIGEHKVTATFAPDQTYNFTSSTTTSTIEVKGKDAGLSFSPPQNVRAESQLPVTATVNPQATGTVDFFFADGQHITTDVTNGRATAELPVPANIGPTEIIAVFTPADGSFFAAAEKRAPVNISDASYTVLELSSSSNTVRPGEEVTVTATLQPVEGTTTATGDVVFSVDGFSQRVAVNDNTASFTFAPDRAADFTVNARFSPVDSTQTEASTQTTITAKSSVTTIEIEKPGTILPLQETVIPVSVSPAAEGTLVARHEGRSVSVPVVAGKADLPLTFHQSGPQQVQLTFTPAQNSSSTATTTTVSVDVASNSYSTATLTIQAADTVKAGTALPLTVNIAPDNGSAESVSGTLTFAVDGEPLVDDAGQSITMPVNGGTSSANLTFTHGGERTVTVTFTNDQGVTASATHTVHVSGAQQSGQGGSADISLSSGSSETGSPFAAFLSFLTPIWTWIKEFFTNLFSSKS